MPCPSARAIPKVKKSQVLLVANGDLRLEANRRCWPAQLELEQALRKAIAESGYELIRAHEYKPAEEHGFILLAEGRHRGLSPDRSAGQADRGRGRVAVFASPAARALVARRADPDRGQLVGPVAGTRGHVELERIADQGRQTILHALERGFHGAPMPPPACPLDRKGPAPSQYRPCHALGGRETSRRRAPLGQGARRAICAAKKRFSACSTKAAWACSTRSCPTSS